MLKDCDHFVKYVIKQEESNLKEQWMQKTGVVWFLAMICCLLWGSAFPCIKIGYKMMHIASSDTASQILYAGCRFTLAGILAVVLGSLTQRQFLLPTKASLPHILELSLLQTILQYLLRRPCLVADRDERKKKGFT